MKPKKIRSANHDNPVKSRLRSQTSKRRIFPLLQLPRELRDMIYLHSISAGNMEILRLNKFVHEEASEFITKHGVLRINLGVHSRTNWAALSSRPCIQHLEFRIDTRLCNSLSRMAALEEFAYSQIARDECLIIFNYGKEEVASPYSFDSLGVFLVLQCLFGFNTVIFKFVVNLVVKKHEATEFRGRLTTEQFQNNSV